MAAPGSRGAHGALGIVAVVAAALGLLLLARPAAADIPAHCLFDQVRAAATRLRDHRPPGPGPPLTSALRSWS